MKEFAQTALHPMGNCWQTAVACLLEVDPAQLPDQSKFDRRLVDGEWIGKSYNNILQAYLRKHHRLVHLGINLPEEGLALIEIAPPGWHLISGETVRTPTNKTRHVVVGRYGKPVWDPHPSRAGLTGDLSYALLVPYPKAWENERMHSEPCLCPACGANA